MEPDAEHAVIVTGASSQVGHFLLPRLVAAGYRVHAVSRHARAASPSDIVWHVADLLQGQGPAVAAGLLIHLAPITLLPSWLANRPPMGLRRLIAFGSTSRFTKSASPAAKERHLARALAAAEDAVVTHCEAHGIAWTVFRPTLIYGCGRDQSIAAIGRFIRRFGFFPILGAASGLRQPVHADDLASACLAILEHPQAFARAYDLSGGETLSYRAMVERIFLAEGREPRFIRIPPTLFAALLAFASHLPGQRHLSAAMAQRMNQDLCFDHLDASRAFGYAPRPFMPKSLAS